LITKHEDEDEDRNREVNQTPDDQQINEDSPESPGRRSKGQ